MSTSSAEPLTLVSGVEPKSCRHGSGRGVSAHEVLVVERPDSEVGAGLEALDSEAGGFGRAVLRQEQQRVPQPGARNDRIGALR
ncbi:MAG: hypothetical protein R2743_02355 [Ilumatobacteraceae bacterium]